MSGSSTAFRQVCFILFVILVASFELAAKTPELKLRIPDKRKVEATEIDYAKIGCELSAPAAPGAYMVTCRLRRTSAEEAPLIVYYMQADGWPNLCAWPGIAPGNVGEEMEWHGFFETDKPVLGIGFGRATTGSPSVEIIDCKLARVDVSSETGGKTSVLQLTIPDKRRVEAAEVDYAKIGCELSAPSCPGVYLVNCKLRRHAASEAPLIVYYMQSEGWPHLCAWPGIAPGNVGEDLEWSALFETDKPLLGIGFGRAISGNPSVEIIDCKLSRLDSTVHQLASSPLSTSRGEVLLSHAKYFVPHPLGIDTSNEPWQYCATKRHGILGTDDCITSFAANGKNNHSVSLDIPMGAGRIHYRKSDFSGLSLPLTADADCEITLQGYRDGACVFTAKYRVTKLKKGYLNIDLREWNKSAASVGLKTADGFDSLNISTNGDVNLKMQLPLLRMTAKESKAILAERTRRWILGLQTHLDMLAAQDFSNKLTAKIQRKLKKDATLTEDELTQANLAIKTSLIQAASRLELKTVSLRIERLAEKKSGKTTEWKKELEKLESDLEDAILKADATSSCLEKTQALKRKIDRFESDVWETWKDAGFHAVREGKTIISPEGVRQSLMGVNDYDVQTMDLQISENDYMYMALNGYRLIREPISQFDFDPKTNRYTPQYIKKYRNALRWGARYGLSAIAEIHYVPSDVLNACGRQEERPFFDAFEAEKFLTEQLDNWSKELKDCPNVIIWEVPSNEPYIGPCGRNRHWTPEQQTIAASPVMMKLWNDYLRRTYGSREQLDAAWRVSGDYSAENGLQDNENWDDGTINPPGLVAAPMAYNARLYDYALFLETAHVELASRLAKVIRKNQPYALMSLPQLCFSANVNLDPARLDGFFLFQGYGPDIDLITLHYDLGEVRRAVGMDVPMYLGECFGQSRRAWEETWRDQGGAIPWAWSTRLRAPEDLIELDENGYPWIDKLIMLKNQKHLHQYPPLAQQYETVILTSKRTTLRGERVYSQTAQTLEQAGIYYRILDQDVVIKRPELLNGFKLIIVENNYQDSRIQSLLANTTATVLWCGAPNLDAYASNMLPQTFAKNGLFWQHTPTVPAEATVRLVGQWEFCLDPQNNSPVTRSRYQQLIPDENFTMLNPSTDDWKPIQVPMGWNQCEQELIGGEIKRGWYRLRFDLPAGWTPDTPCNLFIGGLDDYNWTYLNGQKIGSFTDTWNQKWRAFRCDAIPAGLLKATGNELLIRIQNDTGLGGIWDGPVEIRQCLVKEPMSMDGIDYRCRPLHFSEHDLRNDCEIVAREYDQPAILRQGQHFLDLRGNGLFPCQKNVQFLWTLLPSATGKDEIPPLPEVIRPEVPL